MRRTMRRGKNGRRVKVVLALCLAACAAAFCEDDVTAESATYVAKHEAKGDSEKWEKWWKGRAEQIQADFPDVANEESAADRYLTGWLRDRQERIKARKLSVDEKLAMCRWYLLYKKRGWHIPETVVEHITKKSFDELFGSGKE